MPRPSAGVLGAAAVLLGTGTSLAGIVWDVQWHVDVGPDTFFTLSHLMLYSGSAIAGLAALAMVLRATFAQRAGRTADPAEGGRTVRVLKFDAPLGYLIAGAGAAMFLLYGLMDLWWHTVYGFDADLGSPPHVALFSSITVTMVGSVIVFGYARDRRWGRIGLVVSLPILMTFSPLMLNALAELPAPFDIEIVSAAFFCTLSMLLAAGITGRPAYAIRVAAVLGAMQLALWFFAPWASHSYASMVNLPLRDGLGDAPPELPSATPMFLLVAAAVGAGVLAYGRRAGMSMRLLPQLAGAVGGLVLAFSLDLQVPLVGNGPLAAPGTLVADALAGLLFGALAGFLAWRFAGLLRGESRKPIAIVVPGPAVQGGLA
ncbi:hypothetical protein Asp14428_29360 [Actinoplanes sp. NBRC 14428]|uniref:Uncharacterized protein n=1 Tax=Pseudosporangium ferrugineum TaxID=439699 RepID=A0A2T0RRV1_9ACTN|nr:hypothetical protein [Pseudosporangium ferrugineum]PRY23898.1 hypothetical protein CLV70_11428 [Pseudosporangium ferrugineum]BCJ51461.1 hypothetical protein Asp14428_29360 [Actinoplanes sp. NBRC 14428]